MADVEEIIANALREECDNFEDPVALYVEGEALRRWERDNPDKDGVYDGPKECMGRWDDESWHILARAVIKAVPGLGSG